MSNHPEPDVHGAAAGAQSPELEHLLRRVEGCSPGEKRALLDRLLRDLIGDQPDREYGLYNPDGSAYLYLIPPPLRRTLAETPEFLAELDRRSKNPGKQTPFREVIARLESRP
jgi:hypothetical protein